MIKYSKCAIYANVRWQNQRSQHSIRRIATFLKFSLELWKFFGDRARLLIQDNSANTLEINDHETSSISQSVGNHRDFLFGWARPNGRKGSAISVASIQWKHKWNCIMAMISEPAVRINTFRWVGASAPTHRHRPLSRWTIHSRKHKAVEKKNGVMNAKRMKNATLPPLCYVPAVVMAIAALHGTSLFTSSKLFILTNRMMI